MAHDFGTAPRTRDVQLGEQFGSTKLPHPTNAPYVLRSHPLRWQWVEDEAGAGEWLPLLAARTISPGVDGVDSGGDAAHARERDRRDGWVEIPLTCTPDGRTYVVETECESGWYHHDRWETPRWLGREIMPSQVDVAGYRAWLRWLVAEGHVAPMAPSALAKACAPQVSRIASLTRDLPRYPGLSGQIAQEKRRLAAMRGQADAPPPRRRRAAEQEAA